MALEISDNGVSIQIKDTVTSLTSEIIKTQVVEVGGVFIDGLHTEGDPSHPVYGKAILIIKYHDNKLSVPLGNEQGTLNVSNQATWLNTKAGLQAAISDIQGWF